jgi:hypothetical protein
MHQVMESDKVSLYRCVLECCKTYTRLSFAEALLEIQDFILPFEPKNPIQGRLSQAVWKYGPVNIYKLFCQADGAQAVVLSRDVNAVQEEHVGGNTDGKHRTAPAALCTISNVDKSAMVTTRPISVTYRPRVRLPVATTRCLPPQTAPQTTAQIRRPFKPTHIFAQMFI